MGTLGAGGEEVWFQDKCQMMALHTVWWAEKGCIQIVALWGCGSDCLVSNACHIVGTQVFLLSQSVGSKQRRKWACTQHEVSVSLGAGK